MISARPDPPFDGLAARLAAKAKALAEARLASRGNPRIWPGRWRKARLLWPLFAGR